MTFSGPLSIAECTYVGVWYIVSNVAPNKQHLNTKKAIINEGYRYQRMTSVGWHLLCAIFYQKSSHSIQKLLFGFHIIGGWSQAVPKMAMCICTHLPSHHARLWFLRRWRGSTAMALLSNLTLFNIAWKHQVVSLLFSCTISLQVQGLNSLLTTSAFSCHF
jgi:hypothetical protein